MFLNLYVVPRYIIQFKNFQLKEELFKLVMQFSK